MLFHRLQLDRSVHGGGAARPIAVDGLVIDGDEVWVVACPAGESAVEWLEPSLGEGPTRLCRRIDGNGALQMGVTDPDRDVLLSQLAGGGERF